MLLFLLACSGGGDPVDSGAYCDDAPLVTWDSWGQGFLTEQCQPCHASTAPERNGAPEEVTFDTEDDVISWKELILATATGDSPTMPPALSVEDRDKELLEIWLRCWEE